MTTIKSSKGGHFALQAMAVHGNPYDGHTLKGAIESYEQTVGVTPSHIICGSRVQGP
ncbi:MAG: hypothetical protein J0G29_00895 [Alphaproteobacteria bacterium]|nr:hypothetical protein [Alphaproteobacteria bacterium]